MHLPYERKRDSHSGSTVWIAAILTLFIFAALDAGALAWSASVISGLELAVELLTFFTVIAGAVATVWWMRT